MNLFPYLVVVAALPGLGRMAFNVRFKKMDRYPRVYRFSESFGPPRIDLRRARILDDYGDDTWATLPINHKIPNDVTRKELDFYAWVYSFMNFDDLLFYLYPVTREYERDPNGDFVYSYLYSLDMALPGNLGSLQEPELEALKSGLTWIWSHWGTDYAPWCQCKHLSAFIGVHPS